MAYRFTPSKQSKLEELSSITIDDAALVAGQVLGSTDGVTVSTHDILSLLSDPGDAGAGAVISWDGTSWGFSPGGSVGDLGDLASVTFDPTTLADGQVLKWDSTVGDSGAWVNGADVVGGGGGASVLNDLSDVSTAGLAVTDNGKALVYINAGSGGSWSAQGPFLEASSDAAAVTAAKISNWDTAHGWGDHSSAGYAMIASVITTLSGLSDTHVTGIADGNVLMWNEAESRWDAGAPEGGSVPPGTGQGDVLQWHEDPAGDGSLPAEWTPTGAAGWLGENASAVAVSGSYNDLSDKPSIPNIVDGSDEGDILVWDMTSSQWVATGAPDDDGGDDAHDDPRYVGGGAGIGVSSANFDAGTGVTVAHNVTLDDGTGGGDCWVMCMNEKGVPVSVIIPDITEDATAPGRKIMISDMMGLDQADKISISVAGPAGGTGGSIDMQASEDLFDGASITLLCSGMRIDDDATKGYMWKIV